VTSLQAHERSGSSVFKVMCVVGARPNFMKMAPILRAMAGHVPPLEVVLVHTGQHYDQAMSQQLFDDLGLPTPQVNLEVGSGTHAVQTAEVMRRVEPVMDACQPDCVAVVGDVNSTLACALVAVKKSIPVVHIEAGLRSFDRTMPEEVNRILTDQIADRLYTTERSASDHLKREGIAPERIFFAGNVMIDSVMFGRASARPAADTLQAHGLDSSAFMAPPGFALVTLHRPSNVDHPDVLRGLLETLGQAARSLPMVMVLHPRTRSNIERFGLASWVDQDGMAILPPQGYLEMLGLMDRAAVVLTDSGGLQEETTALGVPCLTLRENTERPITVEQGTNSLVGLDRAAILSGVHEVLAGRGKQGCLPELWDGHAAERIAADLHDWLMHGTATLTPTAVA
jgi:UDP-N-acetylglucosamine 2-epimerase (non-hydrolysing)